MSLIGNPSPPQRSYRLWPWDGNLEL